MNSPNNDQNEVWMIYRDSHGLESDAQSLD